jgi:MFS family permease
MSADTPSSVTPDTIRGDISAPHASSSERIALATTSGAHFLHDGIADSLYVFLPIWAQAFGLNYASVGALKTAYSAAMALFQMPAGILAERTGERSLLVGGTLLAGAAFAGMAIAGGFSSLFLAILLVGIGSAVQHPLASSIIARAYPASQRRSALGIYNFSGDVGKMVVAFSIATAAGLIGWQAAAVGYGATVVVGGALLLLVLHRYALGQSRVTSNEDGGRAALGPPRKGPSTGRRTRLHIAVLHPSHR